MVKDMNGYFEIICDECAFTMVSLPSPTKDLMSSFGRWGWTFSKEKTRCPYCSEDAGMITPEQNMFHNKIV